MEAKPVSARQVGSYRPEVVEDFIRNFLSRHRMAKTLHCFQTEWYTMDQKGLVPAESEIIDDAYTRNSQVSYFLFMAHMRAHILISASRPNWSFEGRACCAQENRRVCRASHSPLISNPPSEAKAEKSKLTKARDYHCLHHRRIAQEKNKLIVEVKRFVREVSPIAWW